jgi:hypothetical protein
LCCGGILLGGCGVGSSYGPVGKSALSILRELLCRLTLRERAIWATNYSLAGAEKSGVLKRFRSSGRMY